MSAIEKLTYNLEEAAARFGVSSKTLSESINRGDLRPPMRRLGDGPNARKIFPKKAFDEFCSEESGMVEIDPRRVRAGNRR